MKIATLLTLFTSITAFNEELSGFDAGRFFIQAGRFKLKLGFLEEKLRSLGTHRPFLTRSRFRQINQEFLAKLTKKRLEKHSYQHKPDKHFNKLQEEKMAVYNVMEALFDGASCGKNIVKLTDTYLIDILSTIHKISFLILCSN